MDWIGNNEARVAEIKRDAGSKVIIAEFHQLLQALTLKVDDWCQGDVIGVAWFFYSILQRKPVTSSFCMSSKAHLGVVV